MLYNLVAAALALTVGVQPAPSTRAGALTMVDTAYDACRPGGKFGKLPASVQMCGATPMIIGADGVSFKGGSQANEVTNARPSPRLQCLTTPTPEAPATNNYNCF